MIVKTNLIKKRTVWLFLEVKTWFLHRYEVEIIISRPLGRSHGNQQFSLLTTIV